MFVEHKNVKSNTRRNIINLWRPKINKNIKVDDFYINWIKAIKLLGEILIINQIKIRYQ